MMTRQERAKQFMAFDAMKGLHEALKDREERHSRVDKHDVSDERARANSDVLGMIERGMSVKLEYYRSFHDVCKTGTVNEINPTLGYLKLDYETVHFEDIYSVKIV